MSFCELHWFSKVLGKQTTTWILLPDQFPGPFATFYLLHGLSDDNTIWMRRTRIETYVENKPLIVVMPDGGRGFYTNHENGPKWAEHIGVELPTMIEKTFCAIASREGRFIGGLSMGGIWSDARGAWVSGSVRVGQQPFQALLRFGGRDEENPDRVLMVGSNPAGSDHDLVELARRAKAAGTLPRLRIDCGVDDFLIEDSRSLHQLLTQLKVPHEYEEFPGVHNWDYWDVHVREAIEFHLGKLA